MKSGGNGFKNATAHKVNSYYALAISCCTFRVGKHSILGPVLQQVIQHAARPRRNDKSKASQHIHSILISGTDCCTTCCSISLRQIEIVESGIYT